MAITRWDPFGEVTPLRERINRLFDEWQPATNGGHDGKSLRAWAPMVDVEDRKDEIVITAEVPGMKQEDIDIELTGDVLTIKGERKMEKDESKGNFVRLERSYGAFQRSFTLGIPTKPDKISATYHDGVLTVKVPKADEIQPRKVKVQTQ